MLFLAHVPTDIVSAKMYARILTSHGLGPRLLPEGLMTSPYEILDYQGTLTLLDPEGCQAIFNRTQTIRFLQDAVSSILDHLWGDGVSLAHYHNSAGQLSESFRDGDRRHLVIDLARAMRRGETLSFDVERTAMVGFTGDSEWLETTIDHPIHHLGQEIVFPPERPCLWAELVAASMIIPLRPFGTSDGRTRLRFSIPHPEAHTPYLVRWRW
jgi:hypothetical protein